MIKNWLGIICLLWVTGLIAGCATLSKEECLRGDWYGVGRQDGYDGYPRDRLQSHREACREYGIMADTAAYERGYEEGLSDFCTPRRGFEQGRQGKTYENVCPPTLEAAFLREYRHGRYIYISEQIDDVESELADVDGEIYFKQDKLRDSDDDDNRNRKKLRKEIESLYERKRSLYEKARSLRDDLYELNYAERQ